MIFTGCCFCLLLFLYSILSCRYGIHCRMWRIYRCLVAKWIECNLFFIFIYFPAIFFNGCWKVFLLVFCLNTVYSLAIYRVISFTIFFFIIFYFCWPCSIPLVTYWKDLDSIGWTYNSFLLDFADFQLGFFYLLVGEFWVIFPIFDGAW